MQVLEDATGAYAGSSDGRLTAYIRVCRPTVQLVIFWAAIRGCKG